MNQLFANAKDNGLGRNMPVHYGSKELNIHTISSTLATQIPHAAGAAYALKMQNIQNPETEPRVAVCYFGEGAASEGDFHAALNIAATRQVPCIFICRNNGYAISTPTSDQYRGDGIASRGAGYGIATLRVDGNDIFAVRRATAEARRLALHDGGRPVLIEMMAYRVGHHSTSDDSFAYRQRVEVEDWKRRDNPITRLRKWLEGKELWDDGKEKELRSSTRKEVLRAFEEAEKEKKPSIKNAFEGVWEELTVYYQQSYPQSPTQTTHTPLISRLLQEANEGARSYPTIHRTQQAWRPSARSTRTLYVLHRLQCEQTLVPAYHPSNY
jgi:2-oxoisovalerate dehydrogenase E1 component alpha subunit